LRRTGIRRGHLVEEGRGHRDHLSCVDPAPVDCNANFVSVTGWVRH
jgi:hypothetical protein